MVVCIVKGLEPFWAHQGFAERSGFKGRADRAQLLHCIDTALTVRVGQQSKVWAISLQVRMVWVKDRNYVYKRCLHVGCQSQQHTRSSCCSSCARLSLLAGAAAEC